MVDKLGWHENLFVTALQTIGHSSEKIVFQNSHAVESAMSVSGTVEDWRESIGLLASGNSQLIFAISADSRIMFHVGFVVILHIMKRSHGFLYKFFVLQITKLFLGDILHLISQFHHFLLKTFSGCSYYFSM